MFKKIVNFWFDPFCRSITSSICKQALVHWRVEILPTVLCLHITHYYKHGINCENLGYPKIRQGLVTFLGRRSMSELNGDINYYYSLCNMEQCS